MDKYHTNTSLDYSSLESGFFDAHRCGSTPFSPQIMADGSQNSCASYCGGFDKNGCNKYLPNYPDDDYIHKYISNGGNCNDFKDCKREKTIPAECSSSTNIIENFEIFPNSSLGEIGNILLCVVFFYLIIKVMFCNN